MQNTLSFEQLGLSTALLQAIADMGYSQPSDIQAKAIPILLQGKDVIGQAQTGTGKTAAFGIPLLELIQAQDTAHPQALVLCPTRELALQVEHELYKLRKYKVGVRSTAIYGGASIEKQIQTLKKGVQIVVGTPGRVLDHLERGTLRLDQVKVVVLDEADEMLNMGFRDDIEQILQQTPASRQTVLFSATMPPAILQLAKQYLKEPEIIRIAARELTVERIEQYYCEVKEELKPALIARFVQAKGFALSMVFCNTKRTTDELADALLQLGINAEALHGDLSQAQRNKVMQQFRHGRCQVLVATDVAARGIDVENVEAVFNYDLPLDDESYVHRIGRTGRAGRNGIAINLVCGRRDLYRLRDIERYTKSNIQPISPPSSQEVLQHHLSQLHDQLQTSHAQLHPIVEKALENLEKKGISSQEIAQALLQIHWQSLLPHIEDINFAPEKQKRTPKSESRSKNSLNRTIQKEKATSGSKSMLRVCLHVGHKDRIKASNIVAAIAEQTGMTGKQIGKIEIFDNFCFVELPRRNSSNWIPTLSRLRINGMQVQAEIAKTKPKKQTVSPS